jgi:CheY-like chemotaxis protein
MMTDSTSRIRVLVAEDDDNARSLLIDLLSTLGHTVVAEVSTGREAFERAKGILMRRTGSSEQEAYRILQRTSQDRSVPMVEIARAVLASEPGFQEAAKEKA